MPDLDPPQVQIKAKTQQIAAVVPVSTPAPELFAEIDARPMFSPGRKGVAAAATGAATLQPPDVTLVGIIVDSQDRLATWRTPASPLATAYRVGATISGLATQRDRAGPYRRPERLDGSGTRSGWMRTRRRPAAASRAARQFSVGLKYATANRPPTKSEEAGTFVKIRSGKARWTALAASLCLAAALCACSSDDTPPPAASSMAQPVAAEPAPATAEPTPLPDTQTSAKFEIYPGSGSFTGAQHPRRAEPSVAGDDAGITLNFVNTDVNDVAKAVLGDYLKLNYEIGPKVQGTVTLRQASRLSTRRCCRALEQALR